MQSNVEELPYPAGKMRVIGMANDIQRLLRQAEKVLKVAKELDPKDSIRVISYSINRLDPAPLLFAPFPLSTSSAMFNKLCDDPNEDDLRDFVASLQKDVTAIYKMANVPGDK